MTFLTLLVKATAILGVALAGTWLARRSRAAVRHVLLTAAFALILLLPIASWITPAFVVTVPASVSGAIAPFDAVAPIVAQASTAVETDAAIDLRTATAAAAMPSSGQWLAAVWAAGAILSLLPVAAGFWQVRALRRSAQPWPDGRAGVDVLAAELNIHRPIETLVHESVSGPMTCGFLRPAILLPPDARSWPDDDLRRALVHELEHVRRGDWICLAWARIIAALYWFDPVVWIAWRRLGLEAERACDDAVLSRSDATTYANQLIDLAQRLSSARQPQLAMANRHDLAARVRALLDGSQCRGRAAAREIWSMAAVTVVLAFGLSAIRLVAAVPSSQAPAGPRPHYDVATIKRCEDEAPRPGAVGTAGGGARGSVDGINATFSPGRAYVPCATTEQLIYLAYGGSGAPVDQRLVNDDLGSGSNPTKVRGGPAWVHSPREKYSLEATAQGVTERAALVGTMLQTLLEDRFKLRLHRETEDVPMRKLVAAKGGLTIKPMKDGDCTPYGQNAPVPADTTKPACGAFTIDARDGLTIWSFSGLGLTAFTDWLGHVVGAHVIDETGLTGKYIIRLQFVPDRDTSASPGRDITPTTAAGPDLFTALQEQLGLKLEPTRGPRGYLVIDAIERPTPDAPVVAPTARAAGPGPRRF